MDKTNIQYCLDTVMFAEVMDIIPKEADITHIDFEIGHTFGKTRYDVPLKLKKLGVKYISLPSNGRKYGGKFRDATKPAMVRNIKAICQEAGVPYSKARVEKMVLELGGTTAVFKMTTKEIRPDDTDQRRKLRVLGMTACSGAVSPFMAKMSMGKYSCKFETITTKRVLCSKISK